jgi:hypothetical protein
MPTWKREPWRGATHPHQVTWAAARPRSRRGCSSVFLLFVKVSGRVGAPGPAPRGKHLETQKGVATEQTRSAPKRIILGIYLKRRPRPKTILSPCGAECKQNLCFKLDRRPRPATILSPCGAGEVAEVLV